MHFLKDLNIFLYIYTFIGAPNPTPTLNYPLLNNIKHKYKCSHTYLLQKLTIKNQYKSITNKSCCIQSLLKPYEVFMRRRE